VTVDSGASDKPSSSGPSGITNPEPPGCIGFGKDTKGGAGGKEVTVTTAAELLSAAAAAGPMIITVKGNILHDVSGGDDNARIFVSSYKTIQGADSKASVDANFAVVEGTHVIFRNLTVSNETGKGTGDAIEISKGSTHIWVDHVTFGQCKDGALDFKRESDLATVSWCKFAYTSATHDHNFANLIGHVDGWEADRGKLRVTMHHNWYADNVIERQPRVRYGQVHVFNNYYGSKRTNYIVGVGVEAQILMEASYFESQGGQTWYNWYAPNKCTSACADGKIRWTDDNVFDNTIVSTWAPNSEVFNPPYEYKHVKQTAAEAKASVMQRAGVLP
jgi:pectate lyase